MQNPNNNIPFDLKESALFSESGYYEINYNGILYRLTVAQISELKNYLSKEDRKNHTPEDWHSALSPGEKMKVLRIYIKS